MTPDVIPVMSELEWTTCWRDKWQCSLMEMMAESVLSDGQRRRLPSTRRTSFPCSASVARNLERTDGVTLEWWQRVHSNKLVQGRALAVIAMPALQSASPMQTTLSHIICPLATSLTPYQNHFMTLFLLWTERVTHRHTPKRDPAGTSFLAHLSVYLVAFLKTFWQIIKKEIKKMNNIKVFIVCTRLHLFLYSCTFSWQSVVAPSYQLCTSVCHSLPLSSETLFAANFLSANVFPFCCTFAMRTIHPSLPLRILNLLHCLGTHALITHSGSVACLVLADSTPYTHSLFYLSIQMITFYAVPSVEHWRYRIIIGK